MRAIDEEGFILMPEIEFPEAPAVSETHPHEATSN